MRKGTHGTNIIKNKLNLVALSTGSDFCAEHEWGCVRLQQAILDWYAKSVDNLFINQLETLAKNNKITDYNKLYTILTTQKPKSRLFSLFSKKIAIPDLVETKKIKPDCTSFVRSKTRAWLYSGKFNIYSADGIVSEDMLIKFLEKQYSSHDSNKPLIGYWDETQFCFCAETSESINTLAEAYALIQAGKAYMGGLFFRATEKLGGIVLAFPDNFDQDQIAYLSIAQEDFIKSYCKKAIKSLNN